MRNYQPSEKRNPHYLPDTLYKMVKSVIKDYDRQKEEYYQIHSNVSVSFSEVKSSPTNRISRPTEERAILAATLSTNLEAVDQALGQIPPEYRDGVISSIKYDSAYPDDADRRTYGRHKRKFVWHVARNLSYV